MSDEPERPWTLTNAQAIADAIFNPLLVEMGFGDLRFEFTLDPTEAGFTAPPGPVTVTYTHIPSDLREAVIDRAVEEYRARQAPEPPEEGR